ncbi:hotdog family protein [Noviherbaspirillum pedocola]|uniref:Acyl-ACP thioesterase n=1 Tax=Noviherbaspirillum pedocola TaxID=2801341 RepID=A0A934W4N1_9BURK|nr:hypothetical protein [Noviherbaspirillum pedocola]MBK4738716.1 hypothetical protein [Noviherbaspirillum pedocola]
MKGNAWRQNPGYYRFGANLSTRYFDMDLERHMNNVALQGLHGKGRMLLHVELFGRNDLLAMTAAVRPVSFATDSLKVSHFPMPLRCGVSLTGIDVHGYTLASVLFQEERCVGLQECRMAAWKDGHAVLLPEQVRTRLESFARQLEDSIKPNGATSVQAEYPWSLSLSSRYGDLDADGLLSEPALARYVEQARVSTLDDVMARSGEDSECGALGLLVAHVGIRVLHHVPPSLSFALAIMVSRVGVYSGNECIAVAENVMVFVDRAVAGRLKFRTPCGRSSCSPAHRSLRKLDFRS